MIIILYILDWLCYILLFINVLYLLVYSLASWRSRPRIAFPVKENKRFAVFIAAYKEDAVILDTVKACVSQTYPGDKYEVVVISDKMKPETNELLSQYPITLLTVNFENSTNTKSLRTALAYLDKAAYDVALVIDADNIIAPDYLANVNGAFANPEVQVVQTHRIAKNIDTDMAYLDAISEEINNSIFRLGHINLGRSAALIGSGMAFDYDLFYSAMMSNESVGGFDRVIEMKLLYKRVFFHYLPDVYVKDEKIKNLNGFYQQRLRWLSAQYYSIGEFIHHLVPAIRDRNWDFCDKLYQQISISRLLLIGFIFVIALFLSCVAPALSHKWWVLFMVLVIALIMAVPRCFWRRRTLKVLLMTPYLFLLMVADLFRLKKASKKFIHTSHG
ncbi:MAG: glycosyltransferase family 2 protein [Bacteroides sp.]|nr:glycosyltransferase family 2 protein [Bacteroides sp.]MCI1683070.1 glycosyltransferase family 2 protein [Bacteroides sp.]